jgi:hypothetical protein
VKETNEWTKRNKLDMYREKEASDEVWVFGE